MSLMSFDILEEMARMRREMDRVVGESGLSSWTFPFSRISFLPGRAARTYPLLKDIKSEYVHRSERAAGHFTRSLSLSAGVESDRIHANYTNGVLKIVLPKVETAKSKQIAVKVS